jgi:hypothetical protein
MEFVELRSFDNYIEANIVLLMLQQSNVNCHLKDEHIVTIDPLLSPAVGGMKLMVHHGHVERAWELLNEAEEQYLKSISCPVCKKHTLKTVAVTREYKCKLSALASMVLNGRPVELKKVYQCTSCGYDFDKIA